jgi:hypothetical protein
VASLRRRFPQPLQIIDPTTTTNKHHNLVSLQLGPLFIKPSALFI